MRANRAAYLHHGRATLGWGVFVLREAMPPSGLESA
jgi:hypothetical protein